MNLASLYHLLGHKPAPAASMAVRRPPPRRADVEIDGDDGGALAVCGWFDSSHALQAGLQVTEHDGNDAVAAQLPLADWLALHLAHWQPEVGAQAS